MYNWIWRHLPGPVAIKLVETLVLFLAIAALLFFVVFPLLESHLPFDHVTTQN